MSKNKRDEENRVWKERKNNKASIPDVPTVESR